MADDLVMPASVVEAMADPRWWGLWFADEETWRPWLAYLRSVFGLPMDEADLALFRQCTGRSSAPTVPAREAWCIVGRRGGKSRIAAVTAAWLAVFGNFGRQLAPGERAIVMVLAADRRQARVAFRYLRSLFSDHQGLKQMIAGETREALVLRNGVTIEIATSSFRSVRGYSVAAIIADEIAFMRSDENSSNPAEEILRALRPAMMRGSLLMAVSSPYARRGPLWDAYRRHFGKDGDPVLVWKAPTRIMNTTVPQADIDEAYENDPASASAEYGAEFRTDVETFVAREVVDAAVVAGRHELPPASGVNYVAFVDPSGGSADSMTIAVAHRDGDRAVLDVVRERKPPFSPDDVVLEFTALLKSYRVTEVCGDRYGGEWPAERFRVHNITYVPAEKPKSDLYRDLLPLLNGGRVELLDNVRLTAQLCGLERRTARSGKDSIDHAPNGHDDLANAVAGVVGRAFGGPAAIDWASLVPAVLAHMRPYRGYGRTGHQLPMLSDNDMRPPASWNQSKRGLPGGPT